MNSDPAVSAPPPRDPGARRSAIPWVLSGLTLGLLAGGYVLMRHMESNAATTALSAEALPVTVLTARRARWRPRRRYVGRVEAWNEAKIGPQIVSAYVLDVRVRPGAHVRRGQLLARLDCRHTQSAREARAMRLRALDTRHAALADEARRYEAMRRQRYVAELEATQREAKRDRAFADLLEARAKLSGAALEESDCELRAPFGGEVARREADPGAFAHPGQALLTLVDRHLVRITADVPESDFELVAPKTPVSIHLFATDERIEGLVARRSPAAHSGTRTVHIEIDLKNPERSIPVGTTAALHVDAGAPKEAMEIPVRTAVVRGHDARVFTVKDHVAHVWRGKVLGERGSSLFLEPTLPSDAHVVLEGRALLRDGDRVRDEEVAWPTPKRIRAGPHGRTAPRRRRRK